MNAIGSKQKQVLKRTRQLLEEAETGRKKLRFSHFIEAFSAGKIELLKNPESAEKLASHLTQLYAEGNHRAVLELIEMIGLCLCREEPLLREHAIGVIVRFSGDLGGANNFTIIVALFKTLTGWLEAEEKLITGYGIGCSQIHKFAQRMFERREFWQETENLLLVLQKINDGRIVKDRTIRDMAVNLQDSLATKSVLRKLLNRYLHDNSENRKKTEIILTHLGRRSIVHMVNTLMKANSKEERLQLISLIPKAGKSIFPVLQEYLKKNPPWYVVRNFIFIVSELQDADAFALVRPYLSYGDIRVQQQVVRCIVRNSEEYREDRLIYALFKVHDELKMPIIMQLARRGSDGAAESLLQLLAQRKSFGQETYIELLVQLCRAFQLCSVAKVIPSLHGLIKERQVHAGPSDPVILAARDTILYLKAKFPDEVASVLLETDLNNNGFGLKHASLRKISVKRSERSVKELVEQGDLENAGKKLFANAVKAARDNDFSSAELLRDKILEISPLALSEVIRLGEIIDEEKSSSISSHHIAIWSELYEKLTTAEFNALYFALKPQRYSDSDIIVKAGETDPSLYFINSGIITISYQSENREKVLKQLEQGEIAGVSAFFDFSVWTVTMKAETGSLVYVLSVKKMKELEKRFPGIEGKLHAYCLNYDTVPKLLQTAGSDRREAPRYPVSVTISNMLLDPYGNAGKRIFKGELIDISRGGLRFSVTISSRDNARMLLGRQIISIIEIEGKEKVKCYGVIIGGRFKEEGRGQDFVVHVNFHQHLEDSSLIQVTNLEMQSM